MPPRSTATPDESLSAATARAAILPPLWRSWRAIVVGRTLSLKYCCIRYAPLTADRRNAYISPANAASFKDLPPTFIIAGEQDPSHDTIEKYVLDLKSAGVAVTISRYANSMHSFFLMAAALDAGKMSIEDAAWDLRQAFKER